LLLLQKFACLRVTDRKAVENLILADTARIAMRDAIIIHDYEESNNPRLQHDMKVLQLLFS